MTRAHNTPETLATDWLGQLLIGLPSPEEDILEPVVEEFKTFIERNASIRILASTMFDNLPKHDPGGNPQISNWRTMLQLARSVGLLTKFSTGQWQRFGAAFFLNEGVNKHLKKILNRWNTYLSSSASAEILKESDWLGPDALSCIAAAANLHDGPPLRFDQIYECDPSKPHYGFSCWDDFFTRRFRAGIRPVDCPNDDSVIVSPCEAKPFTLRTSVKSSDTFWIKSQPYSLQDIFAGSPISYMADSFLGGSIFQAYLSTTTYHRWHSPVSGTIKAHTVIDGTYFAIPPWVTGFAKPGGQADPLVMDNAQGYLAHVNTRAIVVIEADQSGLGLVAFVAVGMHEASSCAVNPEIVSGKKNSIRKGEELGMFHFGGSSYCVLFQAKAKVHWVAAAAA